jgi:hypothetical protein
MATIGNTVATIVDIAKRLDPDGTTAQIAELLMQTNEILPDMLWKEGNLPTGDRTTVRTGLPTVAFRRINEGVAISKSTTAQVDEGAAYLEGFSQVDRALAVMSGNPAAFRLSEATAFFESMNQTMAQNVFYGDAGVTPKAFTGLAPRYNSKSGVSAPNIIDAGGVSTDNTSIWLVVWGDQTVSGLYPKGSKAGLYHEDATANTRGGADGYAIGDVILDASGNPYMGYRDHFAWNCGLRVRDWRGAVRIANIDVSNQVAQSSAANIIRLMIAALHKVKPVIRMGRAAWYMNGTLATALDIQANEKSNLVLNMKEFAGEEVLAMRSIPIRQVDQILNTEAQVV